MASDTEVFAMVTANGESQQNLDSLHLTVVHNRNRYPLELRPETTVHEMKKQLEKLTNISTDMQKLIFQGILQDDCVLANLRLPPRDAKIMLIGSERTHAEKVLKHATSGVTDFTEGDGSLDATSVTKDDDWSSATEHSRVLTIFGKPDEAIVGLTRVKETLSDETPLMGMCDKRGSALRIRFKAPISTLASGPSNTPFSPNPISSSGHELWLTTNSATHKIPLEIIQAVESQPIFSHPEYHIMAFQLGPTPKSRFFVYWVPAQFVDSIKTKATRFRLKRSQK